MRLLRILFQLLLLWACPFTGLAQSYDYRFADADDGQPLAGIALLREDSSLITITDTGGKATIPYASADSIILIRHPGYEGEPLLADGSDTGLHMLHRSSIQLEGATVRANLLKRAFPSSRDNVIDYAFVPGGMIVLVKKGMWGNDAVLYLLDEKGAIRQEWKGSGRPHSLFRSCKGGLYFVSEVGVRRIQLAQDSMNIGTLRPLRVLGPLLSCVAAVADDYYFKTGDEIGVSASFRCMQSGDTALRTLYTTVDSEAARRNEQDIIQTFYPTKPEAVPFNLKLGTINRTMNKMSFARVMKSELHLKDDTLLILDFKERKILYYSRGGYLLRSVPLRLQLAQPYQSGILRDELTDRFYVHYPVSSYTQAVQELDLQTGALVGPRSYLSKHFAARVSIRGGRLYYLYHHPGDGTVQQLWVQSGSARQ